MQAIARISALLNHLRCEALLTERLLVAVSLRASGALVAGPPVAALQCLAEREPNLLRGLSAKKAYFPGPSPMSADLFRRDGIPGVDQNLPVE
eukprot:6271677-Pyramimonas_sp.AAC.1